MQPAYSWFRKPWPFTCQRLREKSQESILIRFSFVSIPLQTSVPHQCCNPVNPSALHFDAQPSPVSIWGAAELDTDGDKRDFWHVLAKNNRRVILSVKKKLQLVCSTEQFWWEEEITAVFEILGCLQVHFVLVLTCHNLICAQFSLIWKIHYFLEVSVISTLINTLCSMLFYPWNPVLLEKRPLVFIVSICL